MQRRPASSFRWRSACERWLFLLALLALLMLFEGGRGTSMVTAGTWKRRQHSGCAPCFVSGPKQNHEHRNLMLLLLLLLLVLWAFAHSQMAEIKKNPLYLIWILTQDMVKWTPLPYKNYLSIPKQKRSRTWNKSV